MAELDSSELIRNICIVAHVDHGKSSFADSLLASNGIISPRLAGTIRYLDSREDEQERGITMESSAVSLLWKVPRPVCADVEAAAKQEVDEYRINVIDTPGHVDFSSEVAVASRLCDGALVLVDAVEGVCTQTITVLRQTYTSQLRPILVINKLDRLILELKLSPAEAYAHLCRLIEDANAVVGSFFGAERMADDERWHERQSAANAAGPTDEEYEERDDSALYFDPVAGNVIFSSALDGWAFRLSRFAQVYAQRLGMKEQVLNKCLWGDWYLVKGGKVVGRKKWEEGGRKGMHCATMMVIQTVWDIYENVVTAPNQDKIQKIVSTLSLRIRPADLRSKDPRALLLSIFSQFLPLAPITFKAIISQLPSPSAAQTQRMPRMLHPSFAGTTTYEAVNEWEKTLLNPESQGRAAALVSKMFAAPKSELPENRRKALTADEMRQRAAAARAERAAATEAGTAIVNDGETAAPPAPPVDEEQEGDVLLGFARVFSGALVKGSTLLALLPKFNSALPVSHSSNTPHVQRIEIEGLYTMMGRELVAVDKVDMGNLCAIRGLEGKVARSATLIQEVEGDDDGVNLAGVQGAPPIVRVALEPENPSEMSKLVQGLKMLSQADPCVESLIQETGEHVILTAGELHLERCLKDLKDRFAKIDITVSEPIVPFRETATSAPDMLPPKAGADRPRGTVLSSSQGGLLNFRVRAVPLPESITSFLSANSKALSSLQRDTKPKKAVAPEDELDLTAVDEEAQTVSKEAFWEALKEVCSNAGREWRGIELAVWSFGPRRTGACLLVDKTQGAPRSMKRRLEKLRALQESGMHSAEDLSKAVDDLSISAVAGADEAGNSLAAEVRELDDNFETAFQLATNRGPLCAEPVTAMAFFLEDVALNFEGIDEDSARSKFSSARGGLISVAQDAFKESVLDWSPRLLLAMYSCDIQATGEVLGKVYAVVARRRGRIVSEEMKEGTAFFTVRALLPVVESFGFASEIRTRTSGAASPQLVFSGFEVLEQDPFWVPRTEEELEDLGEKADRENVAKKYMDTVRRRKGMLVERRIVEHAEKQKTMKNA